MIYPETLLVFRKDRKNIMQEAEKEVTFPVLLIEEIIVGKKLWVQKVMESVAYFL